MNGLRLNIFLERGMSSVAGQYSQGILFDAWKKMNKPESKMILTDAYVVLAEFAHKILYGMGGHLK